MKCMECMVLFNFYYFCAGFSFWNIGETRLEMQTEVQEEDGPRWALLGLGRTHGSAGPRVTPLALIILCVACLGVVCWVGCVLLPNTDLLPVILFKNTWKQNKTLPVWRPGSWSLYSIIKYGGTLQFEGKYMKINTESKVVMCPKDTVEGDVQSTCFPSQLAFLGVLS